MHWGEERIEKTNRNKTKWACYVPRFIAELLRAEDAHVEPHTLESLVAHRSTILQNWENLLGIRFVNFTEKRKTNPFFLWLIIAIRSAAFGPGYTKRSFKKRLPRPVRIFEYMHYLQIIVKKEQIKLTCTPIIWYMSRDQLAIFSSELSNYVIRCE